MTMAAAVAVTTTATTIRRMTAMVASVVMTMGMDATDECGNAPKSDGNNDGKVWGLFPIIFHIHWPGRSWRSS